MSRSGHRYDKATTDISGHNGRQTNRNICSFLHISQLLTRSARLRRGVPMTPSSSSNKPRASRCAPSLAPNQVDVHIPRRPPSNTLFPSHLTRHPSLTIAKPHFPALAFSSAVFALASGFLTTSAMTPPSSFAAFPNSAVSESWFCCDRYMSTRVTCVSPLQKRKKLHKR